MLIANIDLLDEVNIPKIVGREKQIQEINQNLSFLQAEQPAFHSMYWAGLSGSGKTAIKNNYLKPEIEKYNSTRGNKPEIVILDILCSTFKTNKTIFKEIGNQLGCNQDYKSIIDYINKNPKIYIAIFDELNLATDLKTMAYTITNIPYELKPNADSLPKFYSIIISNDLKMEDNLEQGAKSRWTADRLFFERYSPVELFEILKTRKEAINNLKDETLEELTNLVYQHLGGDARLAIKTLYRSVKIAQKLESETLERTHIEAALISINEELNRYKLQDLSSRYNTILGIIKALQLKQTEVISGDVIRAYREITLDYETNSAVISMILKELERRELITRNQRMGIRGRTNLITINPSFIDYINLPASA